MVLYEEIANTPENVLQEGNMRGEVGAWYIEPLQKWYQQSRGAGNEAPR